MNEDTRTLDALDRDLFRWLESRDPWTQRSYGEQAVLNTLRHRRERMAEQRVVVKP